MANVFVAKVKRRLQEESPSEGGEINAGVVSFQ